MADLYSCLAEPAHKTRYLLRAPCMTNPLLDPDNDASIALIGLQDAAPASLAQGLGLFRSVVRIWRQIAPELSRDRAIVATYNLAYFPHAQPGAAQR